MRNFIYILLSLLLSFGLTNESSGQNGYVSLNGKKFQLNGQEWYPMVMNYSISVVQSGTADDVENPAADDFMVVPREEYHPSYDKNHPTYKHPWSRHQNDGVDYGLGAIQAHMQKIKNMNFNTIRLTGFTVSPDSINEMEDFFGRNILNTFGTYKKYFEYIEKVIDAAECAGLKVILLTGRGRNGTNLGGVELAGWQYSNYLNQLAEHFKDNTTIMAYDFYNEPLYEQLLPAKTRLQIYDLVKCWDSAIKEASSFHLTTIGSSGYQNALDWDPNLQEVDFLSFHFYEHNPGDIFKHLTWIAEEVNEPWIVGETGYRQDGSWSSPSDDNLLRNFVYDAMYMTKSAGGSGFSLWNYSDKVSCSSGAEAECNFGLVSLNGTQYPPIYTSCYGYLPLHGADKNPAIYTDIATFMNSPYSNSAPAGPLPYSVVGVPYNNIANEVIGPMVLLGQSYYKNAVKHLNVYDFSVLGGNNSVEIEAGKSIKINSPFVVESGSYFRASILPTNNCVVAAQRTGGESFDEAVSEDNAMHEKGVIYEKGVMNEEGVTQNIVETEPFKIYPNPNNGQFNVELNGYSGVINLVVYDLMGKQVLANNGIENQLQLNISEQPKGIYLVKVTVGTKVFNEKIVYQ
jgi:hypothetical protein